ncbi:flagellar biosynthesis protein FliR [Loktanella sp. S4079]|nr:flagellar biosynthesis protein FliR [Loktanella sp. S4079]
MLTVSQVMIWAGFVVFLRISALMALLPAFGYQSIPMRVRLGLALMFTLVVAPSVSDSVPMIPETLLSAFRLSAPEILSGAFFGMCLRLFVFALQIAGSIAAQATSLSQIFGGSAGADPQPAIGHVLVLGGAALAMLSGLHVQAAGYMLHSYTLVPIGTLMNSEIVSNLGVTEVRRCFELAFSLAAPFLLASLVYNVVLGVINRAMPQLMVSFVGAPAITAGGMLLLLITAPIMLRVWHSSFVGFMDAPFGPIP